jgi:hypothetical protein
MSDDTITRSIIPAHPGWHIATYYASKESDACFGLEPIIAWSIERLDRPESPVHGDAFTDHRTVALTPSSTYDCGKLGYSDDFIWAIRSPDGRFSFPAECLTSKDETEALADAARLNARPRHR